MKLDDTTFGRYMERHDVQEAALDADHKAINVYDTGSTHALAKSECDGLGRLNTLTWREEEFEPKPFLSFGVRMSKQELARLEAEEEAEDRASQKKEG